MEHVGILSILPPLVALGLALWKKQIIPALLVGGLVGALILSQQKFDFFFVFLDRTIRVTGDPDNLMLILFSIFIGSLVKMMESAGGFKGLMALLESGGKQSKKRVFGLTWLIGAFMFLENWSNILVNGTTVGPLYDRLKIPREKLAYFIHSISINIVALIVINSWGAFYMTLLSGQGIDNPFGVVLKAMPFNFYCIVSLIVIFLAMVFDWNLGAMRKAKYTPPLPDKAEAPIQESKPGQKKDAWLVILPVLVMVITLLTSLIITGDGKLTEGKGTASVFYAVIVSMLFLSFQLILSKKTGAKKLQETMYAGMGEFISVGILLALALTLGDLCKEMGTGYYIAGLASNNVPVFLAPAIFFILSCLISFATGTSYGTFSIMVPLAIPVAQAMGIDMALMFAACISGGVFGDNASPFSDTSVITSISARVDVVRHIETQLPYAVISASVAVGLFTVAGLLFS